MTIQDEINNALEQRDEKIKEHKKAYAGLGDIEAWLRSCIGGETHDPQLLDELAPVFWEVQRELVRSRHLTDEFEQPAGSDLMHQRCWRVGNWICTVIADNCTELGSIENADSTTRQSWIFSEVDAFLVSGASLKLKETCNRSVKH